jgi:hypothetical protein
MRTTVLALTLVAAFAAPAFAESEKAAEPKAAHEEAVKKAPAQINDPNWTPCNYQDGDNDDNGCD